MSRLTFSAHRDTIAGGRFLRVVNYHVTPEADRDTIHAELAGYAQDFAAITLADLDTFFETGRWQTERPGLLPVFYEGYRTGHAVAAPICEDLGLVAWFMVCTGFVECPEPEQEAYARAHDIALSADDVARGRLALTWDEVGDLSQRHVVTPHTASHAAIVETVSDADFEREIVEPKQKMDAVTGQSAPAFVWLFGSPWGASPRHDAAVKAAGYRYLFSNTMIHRIN